MRKKVFIGLSLLLLIAIGGTAYLYQKINQFALQKITAKTDQLLILEKGTSSQKLATQLVKEGLIADAALLPFLIRLHPEWSKFKAGVYSLNQIDDVKSLLERLNSGKEVQLSVQWIEGKTFKTWQAQLAKAPYLEQTLKEKSESEISQLIGVPNAHLEGWLAPDTYNYVPYSSDLELLKRAYQRQQKILDEAWQNRAENLPLASPYEMLILASIVEKETGVASERAKVASVFINRLKLKMKLQTDPTVIYGMGDQYQGNIRKKDLETATPYNTYVIDGLPPTPIAMPSREAIEAVAHPEATPYLYFVADGTGGHKFSRNLSEHNQAVQNWLQIEKSKKGKP